MLHSPDIQYLRHHEIDKQKWDHCVGDASNGLIYGHSFYLDQMARHWDGLVFGDYEAIMPLTWNRKFGIHYLYQPAFTACLGVFGNKLNEALIGKFIHSIPSKFRLIEISLNHGNLVTQQGEAITAATNYVLPLNKPYSQLYDNFRENHKRNIQKSIQAGNAVQQNIPISEVIRLNRQQMKQVSPVQEEDYDRFKKLYELLWHGQEAITYGIMSNQNNLLSACAFFFSRDRAYYILVGNHPNGRSTGSSHALLDAFIKDHAGKDLFLDFEGSDIESLALFYAGFGATKEIYPLLRLNRLPWWLKWAK